MIWHLNSAAQANGSGRSAALTYTGGAELLTDGGLEAWTDASNLTNWSKSTAGTSTLNRDNSIPHEGGTFCARLDVDALDSNIFIYQPNKVVAGNYYKLTFAAKTTTPCMINVGYRGASAHLSDIAITTELIEYTIRFIAAENGQVEVGRNFGGGGAGQSIYVTSVSLVQLTDSAWSSFAQHYDDFGVELLADGDTLSYATGSVFRETSRFTNSKVNIILQKSGYEATPVFTFLRDYSPPTYSWSNIGTYDPSVYKLSGLGLTPLKAPWGRITGGHPDLNLLSNGGFEDWAGAYPDSWTGAEAGTSAISKNTATPIANTNSVDFVIDASGSEVSLSQQKTLAPLTIHVLRIMHLETGSAQLKVQIKNLTSSRYWAADQSGWTDVAAYIDLPHRAAAGDTWIYFLTEAKAGEANDTFEISVVNGTGSASQTLTLDDFCVVEKIELNDDFMLTTCSAAAYAAFGFAALRRRIRGLSPNNLNPGEWAYDDGTGDFYYRLGVYESMAALHIEITYGQSWGVAADGIDLSGTGANVSDLEIAFVPRYNLVLEADNPTVNRVLARHGDMGVIKATNVDNAAVNCCIVYDMLESGFYSQPGNNNVYYNCLAYRIQTNHGFFIYDGSTNTRIRNCAAAECREYAFAGAAASFAAGGCTNNAWEGAVTATFPTTSSIQNQDLKLVDPENYDFLLQNDSPCKRVGVMIDGLTLDIEGRIFRNPPDIGPNQIYRRRPSILFVGGKIRFL